MGYDADWHMGRNAMRRVKVKEVDDRGEIQMITVEGLADEEFKFPLRGQPHGMTSVPKVGAIGYGYCANGRPDQFFLVTLEDPKKRKEFADRKEGENTLYADKNQEIYMKENGNMEIKSPNGIVHINPPESA